MSASRGRRGITSEMSELFPMAGYTLGHVDERVSSIYLTPALA